MSRVIRPLSIMLLVSSIFALIVVLGVEASEHSASHSEHPALFLIPAGMFVLGVALATYSGRLDKQAGIDRALAPSVLDALAPRREKLRRQMLGSRQREVAERNEQRYEDRD